MSELARQRIGENIEKHRRDEAWTRVSETLRPALAQAKQRKKAMLEKRRGGM